MEQFYRCWRLFGLGFLIMSIQLIALSKLSKNSENRDGQLSVYEHVEDLSAVLPGTVSTTLTPRTLGRRRVWYASAKGSECQRVSRYRGKIPLPLTALLSTQGSGNTWLRWLIECLTGICTGSLYKELIMRQAAFQCEMLPETSGAFIAYKVHYYHQLPNNNSKVILLIRNPFDALVSDFNRMNTRGNHTALADADVFRTDGWHRFVVERSKEWLDLILAALNRSPEFLVVFYENLKNDLPNELFRLAYFLGIRVNDFRVDCVVQNSVGVAKRVQRKLPNLFTAEEIRIVEKVMADASRALRQRKIENIPSLYHWKN